MFAMRHRAVKSTADADMKGNSVNAGVNANASVKIFGKGVDVGGHVDKGWQKSHTHTESVAKGLINTVAKTATEAASKGVNIYYFP